MSALAASLLPIAGLVALAVAVYALVEIAITSRRLRRRADEATAALLPLVEKADVTVDAANAELLRLDAIIGRFEDVSERLEATSHLVHEVAAAPMEAVAGVGSRVVRLLSGRRARAGEEAPAGATATPPDESRGPTVATGPLLPGEDGGDGIASAGGTDVETESAPSGDGARRADRT